MCHVLLWVSSPDIRFNDNEIKRLLPLNEILIGRHFIRWKINRLSIGLRLTVREFAFS